MRTIIRRIGLHMLRAWWSLKRILDMNSRPILLGMIALVRLSNSRQTSCRQIQVTICQIVFSKEPLLNWKTSIMRISRIQAKNNQVLAVGKEIQWPKAKKTPSRNRSRVIIRSKGSGKWNSKNYWMRKRNSLSKSSNSTRLYRSLSMTTS